MEYQFVVFQGSSKKVIGSRDRRLLKSRCDECARAHRQCSGGSACSHCTRLGQQCTYSVSSRRPVSRSRQVPNCALQSRPIDLDHKIATNSLQDPGSVAIDYFFQRFIPTNSFSGHSSTHMYDVHLYSRSCPQVYHAAAAVGALSIWRCSDTQSPSWSRLAFESYEHSLKALHGQLQAGDWAAGRLQDLWTILLLGIFELMQDQTGQGFIQHMNLGAGQAVQYLGPQYFHRGLARRFFFEMRLMEVNKSILLSQPSPLARSDWRPWTSMSQACEGVKAYHPLEALLDIMACSCEFVVRAINIAEKASCNALLTRLALDSLAQKAYGLFDRLQGWSQTTHHHADNDDSILLAATYHSAISIYLSSPFDYFPTWKARGIATPALEQAQVHEHVDNIVSSVEQILQHRSVAGVLLLVPLRIAGSRSRFDSLSIRRKRIRHLLQQISKTYAVSETVLGDLTGIWEA